MTNSAVEQLNLLNAAQATDVHIVSDDGNEYMAQLRGVSSEGDPHFDSKARFVPTDLSIRSEQEIAVAVNDG